MRLSRKWNFTKETKTEVRKSVIAIRRMINKKKEYLHVECFDCDGMYVDIA